MLVDLLALVWIVLAIRVGVFLVVVVFLIRRALAIRRDVEKRKFGARYSIPVILQGIFSPLPGWDKCFTTEESQVLRATRVYLIQVVFLLTLAFLVNQRARIFIDAQFANRSAPGTTK